MDSETKKISSAWTEPRTHQIENENPLSAFSFSFLYRSEQPSHYKVY